MTTVRLPDLCLVVLVGPSGSGKSTLARRVFRPTEIISSDICRGLVSDDDNDQSATGDAFELLHFLAGKRLARGKLTVIDATSVQRESRASLLALAREHDVPAHAIVLDLPEKVCRERNEKRPDRAFPPHVLRKQMAELRKSVGGLSRERFKGVHVLRSAEEVDALTVERAPLWTNRSVEHGPFDIIGDVHGCGDELEALLGSLGYSLTREDAAPFGFRVVPPEDRRAVFLGDLVDRGPRIADVLRIAMSMVETGSALSVPGNHEMKLLRKLRGKEVKLTHGLAETVEQLDRESDEFRKSVAAFIDRQVSHYVLDDGKLVVAHAGMKERYQGRASGRVREFALFGETTGETDDLGLPVRLDWAAEYRGRAMVVYGHTPVYESRWTNGTICVDNGCVFGGKLTALRYPEKELVSIPAARIYYEPARPLAPVGTSFDSSRGDLLDVDDVAGKRGIETSRMGRVTVREENAAAALETMSRFAVDPRWLVYLPPTMSPPETSKQDGFLERPEEAFDHYRSEGVTRLVCEEKHMGSRAIAVLCRDDSATARFGGEKRGVVFTRTGRPFFSDPSTEVACVDRLSSAIERAGLWTELQATFLVLDLEILPWSAKAQELLSSQYAPVGIAARTGLARANELLSAASHAGVDVAELSLRFQARADRAERYDRAWRRYVWPVSSLADLRLAPFHVLASDHATFFDAPHSVHLGLLDRISDADPELVIRTRRQEVLLGDATSERAGVDFWTSLTNEGGEGMVVKPRTFVTPARRGMAQPGVKVRGPDYLRIIYGPEYDAPEHLVRLRTRSVAAKRSLALREQALGIEALERLVRGEPLYRVHECVFGVLALESSPVDPRL